MELAVTQSIKVKRHQEGTRDAHGNPVESWDEPIEIGVYAIAPTSTSEPMEPGREPVVTKLSVLAPVGVALNPKDQVLINNDLYEVDGDTQDWNNGPFDFKPGISFELVRVEG